MSISGRRVRRSQTMSAVSAVTAAGEKPPGRGREAGQEQQQAGDGAGEQDDAGDIEGGEEGVVSLPGRWCVLGDSEEGEDQGDEGEGDVDEEDRPPAERARQDAAEWQADDGCDLGGDGEVPEDAAGDACFQFVGAVPDQRHGRRVGRRCPDTDQGPGEEEESEGGGSGSDDSRDEEDRQAGQEDAARPEDRGELAHRGLHDGAA